MWIQIFGEFFSIDLCRVETGVDSTPRPPRTKIRCLPYFNAGINIHLPTPPNVYHTHFTHNLRRNSVAYAYTESPWPLSVILSYHAKILAIRKGKVVQVPASAACGCLPPTSSRAGQMGSRGIQQECPGPGCSCTATRCVKRSHAHCLCASGSLPLLQQHRLPPGPPYFSLCSPAMIQVGLGVIRARVSG